MVNVLFVCLGNICRSPMAEMVLKDMVRKRGISKQFHIESAATSREETGNGIHHGTREQLTKVGIPCETHIARVMTRKDYQQFDYLIGMEESNLRIMNRITGGDPYSKIYLLLSFAGEDKDIPDPWYTGDFDATYRDICTGCTALLDYFEQQGLTH